MALLRKLQVKCADLSWERAPMIGQKAPVLVEALGVLLSFLERAATCFGGCHGGDHRAEFLVGRAVSSSQACLLLLSTGYYDEALSIIRGLGEIANLMALFAADRSEFERWKTSDEKLRRRDFSPVKVRLSLEAKDAILVVNESQYGTLSAYSIHASPDTLPQAHNERGTAVVGPLYQEVGFLLCLNELGRAMAFIGVFSTGMIDLNAEIKEAVRSVCRILAEHIGGISIDEPGRPWFKLH